MCSMALNVNKMYIWMNISAFIVLFIFHNCNFLHKERRKNLGENTINAQLFFSTCMKVV